MLTLFVIAFCVLFAALSVVYMLVQRQHARLVWAPVYLFLVWELAEVMNWSNQQLVEKCNYLGVGHASVVLVEVWVSWFLLAMMVLLTSWFALPPKRSKCLAQIKLPMHII